jgi:hypothetical protein
VFKPTGPALGSSSRLAFTLNVIMAKSVSVKRKKPGRPATGTDPLMGFRASPVMRASVVRRAETQPDKPSLSEAIRRLVELGLKAPPPNKRAPNQTMKDSDGRILLPAGGLKAKGK